MLNQLFHHLESKTRWKEMYHCRDLNGNICSGRKYLKGLTMTRQVQEISFRKEINELKQVKAEVSDKEYMKLLDDILIRMIQNMREVTK